MSETVGQYDGRRDGPVHYWFELSYSHYLVLPRSLMQAMPIEWQERMTTCLKQMREACRPLHVKDNYTVLLRGDKGRIVRDPYAEYRHSDVGNLEIPDEGEPEVVSRNCLNCGLTIPPGGWSDSRCPLCGKTWRLTRKGRRVDGDE